MWMTSPCLVDDFIRAGLAVRLHFDGPTERVSAAQGLALYRIAQESLANIAKHAPESEPVVTLHITRSTAELSVVNHLAGRACPPTGLSPGRGLHGMRQRVELLGGAIDVGPSGTPGRCAPRSRCTTAVRRGFRGAMPDMDAGEITVILVDDQELVRSGLRRILRRKDGFVIVAECADGDEVPDAVAQHRPDVVVMDLRMKRVDGIEATRRLGPDGPPVLALTTFNEDELLSGALRAGAAGFVLKDSSAEELIRAVRAVARGDSYLDPAVTSRVLSTYRRVPEAPRTVADRRSDGPRTRCPDTDRQG